MTGAVFAVQGVDALRVVAVTPPGRFPTTVHDPGGWWPVVAAEGVEMVRWSANASWWRRLCSPAGVEALIGSGGSPAQRLRRSRLASAAGRAGDGLTALTRPETFASAQRYVLAIAPLARYLRLLDLAVPGRTFPLVAGLEIDRPAYDSSPALVAAAKADGPLARLIDGVLADYPPQSTERPLDVLLVAVTTPEDLLLAMAVLEGLRRRGVRFHACLADHGYENFTLRPHLERLRASSALDTVFDTIVETKDDRDVVVPAVVRALTAGTAPRGFLTSRSPALAPYLGSAVQDVGSPRVGSPMLPRPVPTFAPEPILVTRLSSRRCYWARCAFCIHNEKYDDARVPSTADVPAAVDALEGWLEAGYRVITLNDEALSPAILAALCDELERLQIASRYPGFRWICRSKLELAFTAALFRRMRRSGCVEVLFGLESASERIRVLMDKHVAGLDRRAILAIVKAAGDAGIGVHINVIAGFPGEASEELVETMSFLGDALTDAPRATYVVNEFVVFPATPVAREPARFGIELVDEPGDMVALIPHRPLEWWRREAATIRRQLPDLRAQLDADLGWSWFREDPDREVAMWLYFGTGHGTLLKAYDVDLRTIRPGRAAVA